MFDENIREWPKKIQQRYMNYLRTSFYFKDPHLRSSFRNALESEKALLAGPFDDMGNSFKRGETARVLADECFPGRSQELHPILLNEPLYLHQQRSIRTTHIEKKNVVVATGTASGKTESFLYPILFELYQQYLDGRINEPGVRALILYPMNALANDQRERIGEICRALQHAGSGFQPKFGQYIGQTPENSRDSSRNATTRLDERLPCELVLRDEMRETPPHILLTNYSMLEYLLIRPNDSPLFDDGRGKHWQFIVLDEAHQYRGAKGMEMGMLIRRLKQRLRDGGRQSSFRCIATSATISSNTGQEERTAVARFAKELFGEPFADSDVVFSEFERNQPSAPRRYHAFLRSLEGAFLIHKGCEDQIVLNRTSKGEDTLPLEIALCRECGQHYYVGLKHNGKLLEAIRDPSHPSFRVEFYLPTSDGDNWLCRRCGLLSDMPPQCDCEATIQVKQCKSDQEHRDQLKKCESCGYQRGGIGDPVREVVYGSDGPNAVIATALHELLPEDRRKVLAFADSRQEAAFFAWYAEDTYRKVRDRNLILRAINAEKVDALGLSLDDLQSRLLHQWTDAGLFRSADTDENKRRQVLISILREVLTDERRLSLSGVGIVKWSVLIPDSLSIPEPIYQSPWNFTPEQAKQFIAYALDEMRPRRAVDLPSGAGKPNWIDVSPWPQTAFGIGPPGGRSHVFQWGGPQSSIVKHFLQRILIENRKSNNVNGNASTSLMEAIWHSLQSVSGEPILTRGKLNGTFRLNPRWLRVKLAEPSDTWECDTCATLTTHNIFNICPRDRCPGTLAIADKHRLAENHYRILYESADLPPILRAEEHTAQIDKDEARQRQEDFKRGSVHLLSSSTTFEVGVDLGDLDVVFLRNVPPEPFNYIQRVGRAGRRHEKPGLALTYCRRNPHDLYHYEDPENRILNGVVNPPSLRMTNKKIILRHMVATAMSAFFRQNKSRFENVKTFVNDWGSSTATVDLKDFCSTQQHLANSLRKIVPEEMHDSIGLANDAWVDSVAGPDSRLSRVESEVCADYLSMTELRKRYFDEHKDYLLGRIRRRMYTIEQESTLNFLSRKAVIPKYGFPVDVVELDTRPEDGKPTRVSLQRDLSQAIAEYAPGGKVVANKLEWESCGIKSVPGKAWSVRHYLYDDQHNFKQWIEDDPSAPQSANRKYLIPEFGFITPLFKQPKNPHGRARRLYTTQPFFQGFDSNATPETKTIRSVRISKALTGTLVVLCEGTLRQGFSICRSCGAHFTGSRSEHTSPNNLICKGTFERFSFGHELETDVVRVQFPGMSDKWNAYSVGYAILLGAAETLNVPSTDLNVTITGGTEPGEIAIVLYDNAPGGAGLVIQLEQEEVFSQMLDSSCLRVKGDCGCDSSCYGCLRSYRNQFAHPHLSRVSALNVLDNI